MSDLAKHCREMARFMDESDQFKPVCGDRLRKAAARIEELEKAIRRHRADIWGVSEVHNTCDRDLYAVVGEEE